MNIFKKKISASQESLNKLQGEFDELNEKYAQLEADFKKVTEEALSFKEDSIIASVEIEQLQTELEEKVEEIAEVQEEIVEVVAAHINVDTLASMKAVEILASVGSEPVEIVEQEDEINFQSEFKKLKGKDLTEFYNKHKTEILKSLKNK